MRDGRDRCPVSYHLVHEDHPWTCCRSWRSSCIVHTKTSLLKRSPNSLKPAGKQAALLPWSAIRHPAVGDLVITASGQAPRYALPRSTVLMSYYLPSSSFPTYFVTYPVHSQAILLVPTT